MLSVKTDLTRMQKTTSQTSDSDQVTQAQAQGRRERLTEWVLPVVTVVALGYGAYYLIWRTSTFNPEAMWLSWALWAAEVFGFVTLALLALMVWRMVRPVPPRPNPGIIVDIFIATFNEPIDILRETVVGCNHIRYPHRTFLLDDGNRDEVRALADSVGCGYIARPTHEGAKAGNINYALLKTDGELVAVLDADHVPLPDFLDNTIGFFQDPCVAVVQGPQLFYNLDSFQHDIQGWHEQQMFFSAIQPGKNRTKSAFWCGCPSVLRRSALEAIGGIVEETITEDLHTSLRLASRGYYTVFVDRPLALGVAPPTAEEFLAQRFRWAQGTMQVLRKENPLWIPGLTLSQRFSFLASMITYFEGPQRLVFFAIPIVALLTGLLPVRTPGVDFWLHFVPYLLLNQGAAVLLSRGSYNIWNIERYSTLKAFTFTSSIVTLFTGRAHPFRVSRKDAASGGMPWRHVIPHLVTAGLSVIAIGVGVFHLFHPLWYRLPPSVIAISLFWMLVVLALLIGAVMQFRRGTRRARYRFPIRANLIWRLSRESVWHPATSIDLSANGIQFAHTGPKLAASDSIELIILPKNAENPIPGQHDERAQTKSDHEVRLMATVTSNHPAPGVTSQRVGLSIREFASEDDANLYAYLLHSQEADK